MKLDRSCKINWFVASLFFAFYFAIISLYYALTQDYLIQDDVRIHIVWLQRFSDPELFPNDFIADYFVYFAPWGLKGIYGLGARLGIEPLVLAKILPAFLGIVTAIYVYWFSLKILPKPLTAFLSSLMITQLIWTNDDLISATPRAFIYPLFAAFLYYLTTKNLVACLIAMFLLGLFYPQVLLVEISVLGLSLFDFQSKFFLSLNHKKYIAILRFIKYSIFPFYPSPLSKQNPDLHNKYKKHYIWFISALIISAIALFPFSQRSPEWSTVVTARQMQQIPEFNFNGRSVFYGVSWLKFIFAGDSGLCLPNFPPIIWLGFILPWLLQQPLQTIRAIQPQIKILGQVIVASLLMFVSAHLLLLKIHLPSRYTYHSLRFVCAIAFAIVLTALLEISLNWLNKKNQFSFLDRVAIVLSSAFFTLALIFPMIPLATNGWLQNWRGGTETELYQYLAKQPKNTLVASLSNEANYIPAFTQRSILVSEEFAFPYHPYYHQEIIRRAKDLIKAQYSSDSQTLISFIDRYKISFILLDKTAFIPEYLASKNWLIHSSWQDRTRSAIKKIETQKAFTLEQLIQPCSVISTQRINLIETQCIIDNLTKR